MTSRTTAGSFQEARLPVRAKLAAAWASFMFFYVYVDVLGFYKPGVLDDILVGEIAGFDIGPTFIALALTLVAVPALMVALSAALPARAARALNLVVAALYVPVSMVNALGESWDYAYFYGLSIGLEVLLLAFILRAAWTWPRTTRATAGRDLAPARV
jgi:hypothetical protein